jgi:hypothetical protein
MDITAKILRHKDFYQSDKDGIPPYRLTPSEHKELSQNVNELARICGLPKNFGMIKAFYGVPIELVLIVDDIN